jgi:hypothetical protein
MKARHSTTAYEHCCASFHSAVEGNMVRVRAILEAACDARKPIIQQPWRFVSDNPGAWVRRCQSHGGWFLGWFLDAKRTAQALR